MSNVNRDRAGINELLEVAESPAELRSLLAKAKSYTHISAGTLARAKRIAAQREHEFEVAKEQAAVAAARKGKSKRKL